MATIQTTDMDNYIESLVDKAMGNQFDHNEPREIKRPHHHELPVEGEKATVKETNTS